MFCKNCGNKLNEDSKFCRNCGNTVNTSTIEKNYIQEETAENYVPSWQGYTPNVNNKSFNFKNIPMVWKVVGSIASVIVVILGIVLVANILNAADFYLGDVYNDYHDNYNSYGGNNNNNNTSAKFEWVVEPSIKTDTSYYYVSKSIVGEIKNISNTTYSYVSIKFIIYDSSGRQIDTAFDSISNFKSGNTWKFSASSLTDMSKVASFEFLEISYY